MTTRTDKALDALGRQAQAAWHRLKTHRNWTDWTIVGAFLVHAQNAAMSQIGTDKPVGSAYNKIYGDILRRYKLDQVDKGVRSRLGNIMTNIGEVEAFLATLTLPVRLSLNHPNSIYRAWKRGTTAPVERKASDAVRIKQLTKALSDAYSYIKELEKELENARPKVSTRYGATPMVITSRPDGDRGRQPPTD
jgi:hypothetical protein